MLGKEAEAKREELEDKQKLIRGEEKDYRGQLENLLEHFNEQVAMVKCFGMNLPLLHIWTFILQILPKEP